MIPLVMSIIAKTETFQRDMARARGHVGKFESQIRKSQITMTGFSRSLLRLAGVGGGLYLLQRGFRGTIEAAVEQQKAETALRAAIGENIEGMKRYAAGMQRLTIYGDEQIISQMAYGANLGITTDKLQDATKAAIGLAAKFRLDLSSAMMLVGRASQGQTQLLTRYGIVLDQNLTPQEKFNELLKIGADAFHLARRETEDAAGAYAQFNNMVGDLQETLGGPLLESLTKVLKEVNANSEAWSNFFKVQAEGWAEVFSGFKSLRTILDELSKKAKSQASRRYTTGAWGFTPSEMIGISERARGITRPEELPEGKLEISPRGYQRLAEMRANLRRMEMEAEKEAIQKEFIGPPKPSAKELQEGLREVEKANYDIARAYERMFNSIDAKNKESFEWRKKLIEAEFRIYEKDIQDKILLAEVKKERMIQLSIEEAKASSDALAGVGAAITELNRELPTLGQLFYDLTKVGVDGLVGGLNEALWKTKELDEAMKELGLTMAKMATQWLLQQAVVGGLTGIGGALGIGMAAPMAHSGGRVGSLTSHRFISPTVFTGASRYHDLKPGETAVIAQDDEVISRPMMGGSNIESLLSQMLKTMQERQTINATIVDKRDVVTGERMEGREGERWTMGHVRKNS